MSRIWHLLKRPGQREGEVIPPYTGPKCPFYGFVGCGTFFMGDGAESGNACALTCEHRPCQMERMGQTPNWDKCPVYNHDRNEPMVAYLMDQVKVAPKAYWPKGASSWSGMTLRTWFEHVMSRPYP